MITSRYSRGVAVAVVHIPAEGFKERVEEFLAQLGFVVLAGAVGFAVFS